MRFALVPAACLAAAGCYIPNGRPNELTRISPRAEATASGSGVQLEDRVFAYAGGSYALTLIRPRSGDAKAPVVIVLHGRGSNNKNAIAAYGMAAFAEKHGCLIIAPNGHDNRWLDLSGDPGQEVELRFFSSLLDAIPRMGGDPHRVYVTGFSNGGGMTHLLGATFPDRIAAIAPGGASIGALDFELKYHTIPRPKRPISVLMFHGMRDEISGYDMHTFTVAAPDTARWWARNDGISKGPVRTLLAKGKLLVDRYAGRNGIEVVLMSYRDMGHQWPSSQDKATGVVFDDALWDFFSRHRI